MARAEQAQRVPIIIEMLYCNNIVIKTDDGTKTYSF